jgi:ABC-2 type transport system permease protein
MAIILGGVMVPALSVIGEKQAHTLQALNVTPAGLGEIFGAKTLLGVLLGTLTALITLALNRAFGRDPLLLILVLLMSALSASLFGALIGALLKDMNTLLAVLKACGLLLIAPAVLDLIPRAPNWIAKVFPTYYLLHPVMQVVEKGAGWAAIRLDLLVLLVLILALAVALGMVLQRQQRRLALL